MGHGHLVHLPNGHVLLVLFQELLQHELVIQKQGAVLVLTQVGLQGLHVHHHGGLAHELRLLHIGL